jgi:TorA maturation chaperone TorD
MRPPKTYPLHEFVTTKGLSDLLIHGPTDKAMQACATLLKLSSLSAQVPLEQLEAVKLILAPVFENTQATREDIWQRLFRSYNRIRAVVRYKANLKIDVARRKVTFSDID